MDNFDGGRYVEVSFDNNNKLLRDAADNVSWESQQNIAPDKVSAIDVTLKDVTDRQIEQINKSSFEVEANGTQLTSHSTDKDSSQVLVKMQPNIKSVLQPHQVEGIRFMYEKVVNDCGCILAHGMGLGKTLQALTLCDIFPHWKIVCVLPVTLVSVWQKEYEKFQWRYEMFIVVSKTKVLETIDKWTQRKGIFIIGYEMYASILNLKDEKSKSMVMRPDMIIFDEGHRIKNMDSKLYSTLRNIDCTRRVILTGYPLQNNLTEYWCMVDYIQPNYLGSLERFKQIFVTPIEKGQCIDSTADDVNIMKHRVYVLHELLSKFIQRQSEELVKNALPSLHHNVILIKMTKLQNEFTDECIKVCGRNALSQYAITLRITSHPDMVNIENDATQDDEVDRTELKRCQFIFPSGYVPNVLQSSPKLELCLEILHESVKANDKVVIFSQSLGSLDIIEEYLQSSANYKWVNTWNYFRLDGTTRQKDRSAMLNEFNSNNNIKLFLMSTKTCALGLDLTSANRMIIFDSCWNPCLDMQAVSRVHRYGQKKSCFVYRLVTDHCLEKSVYDRQVNKQLLFARVVDGSCPAPFLSKKEHSSVLNLTGRKSTNLDVHIQNNDHVLHTLCNTKSELLSDLPFNHQMFLLDKDVELSADEKCIAMTTFKSVSSTDTQNGETEQNDVTESRFKVSRKRVSSKRSSAKRPLREAGQIQTVPTSKRVAIDVTLKDVTDRQIEQIDKSSFEVEANVTGTENQSDSLERPVGDNVVSEAVVTIEDVTDRQIEQIDKSSFEVEANVTGTENQSDSLERPVGDNVVSEAVVTIEDVTDRQIEQIDKSSFEVEANVTGTENQSDSLERPVGDNVVSEAVVTIEDVTDRQIEQIDKSSFEVEANVTGTENQSDSLERPVGDNVVSEAVVTKCIYGNVGRGHRILCRTKYEVTSKRNFVSNYST